MSTLLVEPGLPANRRVVRIGHLSIPFRPRPVLATLLIAVVAAAVAVLSTFLGDFALPPDRVLDSLLGRGTAGVDFIVLDLRLARAVCAAAVGAALGAAGAAFQSLTRNPLGSPDIIGFTSGAATGALLQILVFGGGSTAVAAGALVGGLVSALLVYGLSAGRGAVGYRLVLVGIGLNAVLWAVNWYLRLTARLEDAMSAQVWLIGSLNGRSWAQTWPMLITVLVLGPLLAVVGRPLGLLEMGDDAARGLGVRAERTRLLTVLLAVGLTAVAVATAGPIAFVALAAPQLARRLTASTAVGELSAALMGAALLAAGDLVAQRLFAPTQLPVGVVTGALGGSYLVWLLVTEWRRGRG